MSARQLFGGAIEAVMPQELIDASDLRQVPDTQEVFLYPDSSVSIVVEILERVEPDIPQDAVKFHFDSLANDNDATNSQVHSVDILPKQADDKTPAIIRLYGTQHIKKFNRRTEDRVEIYMSLYRIDDKPIDLVVTFNIPTESEDGGAVKSTALIQDHFDQMIRSLRIVDFGLFA